MVTPVGCCARQTRRPCAPASPGCPSRTSRTSTASRRDGPDRMTRPAAPRRRRWRTPPPARQRRRLLRMGAPALAECLAGLGPSTPAAPPLPLLLGAPEARPGGGQPAVDFTLLQQLATQAGQTLDLAAQPIRAQGRASGLLALEQALGILARGESDCVLIGGIDSYLDSPPVAGAGRRGAAVQRRGSGWLHPRRGRRLPGRRARGRRRAHGDAAAGQPAGRRASARSPGTFTASSPIEARGWRRPSRPSSIGSPQAGARAHACTRASTARASGPRSSASRASATTRASRSRCGPSTRRTPSGTWARRWGRSMLGLAALGLRGGYRAGPALVYCGLGSRGARRGAARRRLSRRSSGCASRPRKRRANS